jgi:Fur family transcriptional regulator, ferric uptake regulator
MKEPLEFGARARQLLDATRGRPTAGRLVVLETLLLSPRALSHHEIEEAIARRGIEIDRVTVYRVLDWLVERGLAHRISAEDRVWRFNAVGQHHPADHAHFHCTRCQQVFCLEGPQSATKVALPAGYLPERTEIIVHGHCPRCAG